jgi:hypothetical protein
VDTEKHYLEFSRHSCISDAHKDKINDMMVDQTRAFLYTIGTDKRLNVINMSEKKVISHLKTANAVMKAMTIDYELKRLYVSSYFG